MRNQKIYLHYPQLLDTEKVQLIEILPHGSQYHGCWWFGDARSQDISSHCIDLVFSALSSNEQDQFAYYKSKSLFDIPALASDGSIHWGLDKMAASFQATFSKEFSWMATTEWWSKFHWKIKFPTLSTVNILAVTGPFTDHVVFLTHWCWVMHICIGNLTIIGSDNGLSVVAWLVQSHYLNQCWNIVYWTLKNILQWNLHLNSYIFIKENTFEMAVCKMTAVLSLPQSVKTQTIQKHKKIPYKKIAISIYDIT